nr:hypothetical protein [Dyella sp. ASV24]
MFDRSWIGYPGPSLFEYLLVFAILFLAGNAWTICFNWYIDFLMGRKEKIHE